MRDATVMKEQFLSFNLEDKVGVGGGSNVASIFSDRGLFGRAGRYGSKFPVGQVTCMVGEDLPLLHSSLKSSSSVIEGAGLFPTFELMFLYSRLHPENGLHQILEYFVENSKVSANYFIANCEEMLKVAAIVDEFPLGLHEKYIFCISPVYLDDEIASQGFIQFAQTYAKKGIVRLLEIFTPGTLQVPKTQDGLKELESIHKVLDLYVWLSFRLEESFPDRDLASTQKAICSLLIEEFLERIGWQNPGARKLSTRTRLSSRPTLSQHMRHYL